MKLNILNAQMNMTEILFGKGDGKIILKKLTVALSKGYRS